MKTLSRVLAACLSSLLGVLGVAQAQAPSAAAASEAARPEMTDVALLEYLTGEVAMAPRASRDVRGAIVRR